MNEQFEKNNELFPEKDIPLLSCKETWIQNEHGSNNVSAMNFPYKVCVRSH